MGVAGAVNATAGTAGSMSQGGSPSSAAGSGSGTGGSPVATAGSAGLGGTAAGASGQAGQGGSAGTGGASAEILSAQPASGLWTAVRYYPGGAGIPDNRTNGPQEGPEKTFTLHNSGSAALDVTLALSGADAAKFTITAPAGMTANIAPGADLSVKMRLTTQSAMLGAAPAQDDGATALNAVLTVSGAGSTLMLRQYALVLTYVELEPTFGQILKGFPAYTTKLPSWLPDDANPNPGSPLPGVEPNTDEVAAPAFERLDATQPVTMRPLGRFSPKGPVPFGWYAPGAVAGRTTVATLAEQADPHTFDKARTLEPPLASGSQSFEPGSAKFAIWMAPAGVGVLASTDADGFDKQHRVRSWTLRDAAGTVIPGSFLVGGEEAANGDYQDYVFVLTNVKPAP
jgi:hypothetical protein